MKWLAFDQASRFWIYVIIPNHMITGNILHFQVTYHFSLDFIDSLQSEDLTSALVCHVEHLTNSPLSHFQIKLKVCGTFVKYWCGRSWGRHRLFLPFYLKALFGEFLFLVPSGWASLSSLSIAFTTFVSSHLIECGCIFCQVKVWSFEVCLQISVSDELRDYLQE